MDATSGVQFVTTGSYPARAGNSVSLLIDGEPAFRRICEAIETALHSVWVTVTFMWPEFQMPDGRGSALEVLHQAAQRGLDVRVIFWRPDEATVAHKRNAFWGSREHFELLKQFKDPLSIRWDQAHPGYCQHQKSWLIDAGQDHQRAFVGGINLNPHSMVAPGHKGEGQNHDVYVELTGPAVGDVHHNFVQRWNETSERIREDGTWGKNAKTVLDFPTQLPAECGTATVQVQRTIHSKRYSNPQPPVNGLAYDISSGERTIFDQYLHAIKSARQTIYLENQYLELREIVEALHDTLKRGVEVLALMPAAPDISPTAYDSTERSSFFQVRAALAKFQNFTLAGMAGLSSDGRRQTVYVHSKMMLIDDVWATVGSANFHHYSMFGNGELNVAISSQDSVRSFRAALFKEHLKIDTSRISDLEALRMFKEISKTNRDRHMKNDPHWQGLVFSLDAASYGKVKQF